MTGPSEPLSRPQDHGQSDDDQHARDLGIDPQSYRYWKRVCAALPPMTPEEIAAVGMVLRRIDARLAKQTPPTAVATAAMQDDFRKRLRDAQNRLRPEGILLLGAPQHEIASLLGLPVPGKGEWVSARVVPARNKGLTTAVVDGRPWVLASPSDPIVEDPRLCEGRGSGGTAA